MKVEMILAVELTVGVEYITKLLSIAICTPDLQRILDKMTFLLRQSFS